MMYLCQFGQNLAIGEEDRVQTSLFLYVPEDHVYKVEVTKILQFVLAVPDKYMCKFRLNPSSGS